jgi:basic membrane protein A
MKKILLLLFGLTLTVTSYIALDPAEAPAQTKEIKASFIYVGPVSDAGGTYAHYGDRKERGKSPFVQPSTYIESVPEDAKSAHDINGLVQKRHNLILPTSFGYMNASLVGCAVIINKSERRDVEAILTLADLQEMVS